MKPPPRNPRLDINELEIAFEYHASFDPSFDDEPDCSFLDLTSGEILHPESEEEAGKLFDDGNLIELPAGLFENMQGGALDEFVGSLPDGPLRADLERTIRSTGAFRRFKDIVFGGGNVELKHRWDWFEARRKRERIVEWLRSENVEPDWVCDIFEAPPLPDKRGDLLRAVLTFVREARHLSGVRRIALLGSLATPKAIPKDVDLLVEVADDMPLDKLARLKRRLLGETMRTGDGCGADVFLCNPQREYIGRVCSWKSCAPGIRMSCHAQHCGRRTYLHDDLQNVNFDPVLISDPPLELWPEIKVRAEMPDDVRNELLAPIRAVLPG